MSIQMITPHDNPGENLDDREDNPDTNLVDNPNYNTDANLTDNPNDNTR
jgi:hypothetical protein